MAKESINWGSVVKFSHFSYIAIAALSMAALAGCSTATPAPQSAPATTIFVTQTPAPPTEPSSAPSVAPTEEPQSAPSKVTVPNGVGKDYQTAQDLWRAAGLVVLPATDALGANRLPVIDSNWVVLSQSPKAGSSVESGASITATVKKYTDN
jgi:beta-lactam-binding protein with PASTA domain